MKTAKRLELIQEYYFSRKLKEINSLISAGKPIINLGIGSPDIMPPSSVVEKLKKSLDSPVAHKYQGYKGIEPFRTAIKDFYQNNYNVKLDPNSQILPLIGSYCFNQSILLLNVIPVSDKSSQSNIFPPILGAIELISLEKTMSPCSSSTPFPL